MLVAALLVLPIAVVIADIFAPSTGTWAHLAATVLPEYVANTLGLLVGVGGGVILLGVSTAWLVTAFRFPGRSLFEWALVLPLAVPAYVMAYAYTDLLQFAGPVQSWLRAATGWQAREYWFPEIRSLGGAVAMFSFVLYPYVYLLARAAFLEQSASLTEAGRLLGRSAWGNFARVAVPLARPAIAAGASLALMETLTDFGTVSYFAVQTFTTGIYHAWLSLGDLTAAGQLSAALLGFVLVVLTLERLNRGAARFDNPSARIRATAISLHGARAVAAFCLCLLPILVGFLLPAGILLHLALTAPEAQLTGRFLGLVTNSVSVAAVTSIIAVALATLMAYAARLSGSRAVTFASRIASLGYAVPGAVIAVGIVVPVARLDNLLADWLEAQFDVRIGLLMTGSIAALVYAYLVRFLAIALQTVEAGLGKIRPSMEDAARSLGYAPGGALLKVHAPMMRASLITAGLIVFVDVMKELPATFMMRPFNFDTLAVQAFNYASDERLAEAAAASLVIVAAGSLPLLILSRAIASRRR